MCSNLPSRTTWEAQHKHDKQAERIYHKPDGTVQHHQGEPQRWGAAEIGAVTPEMGELPTQTTKKNSMESLALGALLGTDSLLYVLDGNKDFADEASKQSISNRQRESVPLVSSIEAGCYSTAEDIAGFSSGKRSQIFERMIWLHGVYDSVGIYQTLNREEKTTAGCLILGRWEPCGCSSELSGKGLRVWYNC